MIIESLSAAFLVDGEGDGERKRVFELGSESSSSCWDFLKDDVVAEVYGHVESLSARSKSGS
jgi:hypothetical protein